MNKTLVSHVREDLSLMLPKYSLIQDALEGELAIKNKTSKYLPVPSFCGSIEDERYKSYLKRAVYYNVTLPTRDALVGQIFLRAPLIKLPERLKNLENNINGEGLTLALLVRKAANHVLPFGRGGFLTDFPKTDKEVTLADLESGEYNPFIQFYPPWAITNWLFKKVGNVKKLTMLILKEVYEEKKDNGFLVELKDQHRVYEIQNGACNVSIYKESLFQETFVVKDGNGLPLTEIPFEFIGSENNDADMDYPPFYNLANLNLAHFRNSADYEESVFLTGQPTPVYTGLTEDWVNNYFKDGIPFGSRASVPLPQGAIAQLLQAAPNTLAYEAMTHKEE
ncbi:MAG: DUF4055 domain-containing protein, partial [Culicoidibacterales bacterium]